MSEFMRQLKRDAMMGVTLPRGRFFKPKPKFFKVLAEHKVGWVDAGCGSGELAHEARPHGITMLGIDLCAREGQMPDVVQLDATQMPYSSHLWPVICRPSHDGWAGDVIDCAHRRGARVLYVSKPGNFDLDVPDGLTVLSKHENVGMDGEHAWLLAP